MLFVNYYFTYYHDSPFGENNHIVKYINQAIFLAMTMLRIKISGFLSGLNQRVRGLRSRVYERQPGRVAIFASYSLLLKKASGLSS